MKKSIIKILLVVTVMLTVGLGISGCISGITAAGWSGGTVSGNTLYVGTRYGQLAAVNLTDGSRVFSQQVKMASTSSYLSCACGTSSAPVAIYGNPVSAGDLVYFAGYNGKIYAYYTNSLNGTDAWEYPRGADLLKPFVGGIAYSNGVLYIGDSNGKVYALDAVKGVEIWSVAPEGKKSNEKIWSTPAVSGNTLYIGSFDKKMYALNTADGSKKWEFTTNGPIMATPVINNGTLFFGSLDRNLYALNAADGKEKWHVMAKNWFWTEPVIVNNTVYVGSLDGYIYVLNADTGAQIAAVNLKNPLASQPVVVDTSIIFATTKGVVYSLDTATNQAAQLADFKMAIDGALAAANGIVYFQTPDFALQRVNVASGSVLPAISLRGP